MSTTNPGAQGARPRLVAKSNTGHQVGSKPIGNNYKESGPDPLQVWNKNRGAYTRTLAHAFADGLP